MKTLPKLMKEKGYSVKTLSKSSGLPVSTLHEWLGGRSPRNFVQVKKVADVLGVSLNRLLFDEPDKHETISLNQILKDDLFNGTFEISVKRVRIKGEQ